MPDLQALPAPLRAGDERIELPPKVLETPIIPFDQSPKSFTNELYMDRAVLSRTKVLFINRLPRNTELYSLMTAKFVEV